MLSHASITYPTTAKLVPRVWERPETKVWNFEIVKLLGLLITITIT